MYEAFDIIILDPPHEFWRTRKPELLKLIEGLRESGAAKPEAVWVIGHPYDAPQQKDLSFIGRLDHRGYGEAHVTVVNRRKPEEDPETESGTASETADEGDRATPDGE